MIKNPTVKEFIEKLKKFDENSIVCIYDASTDEKSSVEHTYETSDKYINDDGDATEGKIVVIVG